MRTCVEELWDCVELLTIKKTKEVISENIIVINGCEASRKHDLAQNLKKTYIVQKFTTRCVMERRALRRTNTRGRPICGDESTESVVQESERKGLKTNGKVPSSKPTTVTSAGPTPLPVAEVSEGSILNSDQTAAIQGQGSKSSDQSQNGCTEEQKLVTMFPRAKPGKGSVFHDSSSESDLEAMNAYQTLEPAPLMVPPMPVCQRCKNWGMKCTNPLGHGPELAAPLKVSQLFAKEVHPRIVA